jgi:hypothetical protein
MAARPRDRKRCVQADGGVRRAVLAGQREWLPARIAQAPDLIVQAIRVGPRSAGCS